MSQWPLRRAASANSPSTISADARSTASQRLVSGRTAAKQRWKTFGSRWPEVRLSAPVRRARHPMPRLLGAREPLSSRAWQRTGVSRALADEGLGRGGALSRGCARGSSPCELGGGQGAASGLADDAMTDPFNAMTDPFTRRRAERRAEWRAGIILFLLGAAVFALAISYLARMVGADLTAVWATAIR